MKVNSKSKEVLSAAMLESIDLERATLAVGGTAEDAAAASIKGSLGVFKVKLSGSINVQAQKAVDLAGEFTTDADSTIEALDELSKVDESDEIFKSAAQEAASNMSEGIAKLKVDLEGIGGKLKRMVSAVKGSDVETLKRLEKDLKGPAKDIEGAKKKHMTAAIRQAKGLIAAKKKGKKGEPKAVIQIPNATPPRITMLLTLEGCGKPTGSLLQAKSGECAHVGSSLKAGGDPVAGFFELSFARSAKKGLEKHCETSSWGVTPYIDDAKGKKVIRVLKEHFDHMCFSRHPLPKIEWCKKIYVTELYMTASNFVQTLMTHMCSMEARLCLEGEALLFCYPASSLPGSDLYQKRHYLNSANCEELRGTLHDGFVIKHVPGKVVVLPSGFFITVVSCSGYLGLRWAMSSDHLDTQRVMLYLGAAVQAFPELRTPGTGYAEFHEYLQADELIVQLLYLLFTNN